MKTDFVCAILLAYLTSSIPTLSLVVKRFYGIELDRVGSKNVGIANIFRHAPKRAGYLAVLYQGREFSVKNPVLTYPLSHADHLFETVGMSAGAER